MSDTMEFTIAWDPYMRSVVNMFGELKEAGVFLDCTLCSRGGEYIRAHRVIVSACSPYLKALLMSAPEPNPVLVLSEVNFKQLQYIVAFMYSGCVKVAESDLYSLLEVARILNVTGLCLSSNSVDAMFPQAKENEDEDVNIQFDLLNQGKVQDSSKNHIRFNCNFTCNNNTEATEDRPARNQGKPDVITLDDPFGGQIVATSDREKTRKTSHSPAKSPLVKAQSGKVEKRGRGRPRLAPKVNLPKVVLTKPTSPTAELVKKRVAKKRATYTNDSSPTRTPMSSEQARSLRSISGPQNVSLFDLDPACPYCRKEFIMTATCERHVKMCPKNPLNYPNSTSTPPVEQPTLTSPSPPQLNGTPTKHPSLQPPPASPRPGTPPVVPTGTPVKSVGQLRCHYCGTVFPKPEALLFHLRTQHPIKLLDARVIGYECSTDTPIYFCAKCSSLDSDTSNHSSGDCLKTPAEINLAKSARALHGARPSCR